MAPALTVPLFLRPVRLGDTLVSVVNRLPTMPPVKPLPVTKPLLTMFVSPFVFIWVASTVPNTPPTPTLRQREFSPSGPAAAAAERAGSESSTNSGVPAVTCWPSVT